MNLAEIKIILARLGIDTSLLKETKEGQLQVSCPLAPFIHQTKSDNHPSMGIQFGKKTSWTRYHCFTCGSSGKLWDLLETVGTLSKRDDLLRLAAHILEYDKPSISARFRGISEVEEIEEKQYILDRKILDRLYFPLESKAKEYAISRGLTYEACIEWELKFDDKQERIIFPVYDEARNLRGAVGRTINGGIPKYYNYFGFNARYTLGGQDHFKKDRPKLILVEGFFDLLNCYKWAWELGADVACTWSANLTEEQAAILLGLDKSVLICYDRDDPGIRGGIKAEKLLKKGAFGIRRIKWENKDLDVGSMTKDQFLTALKRK